jgi:hypothetical protein
MADVSEVEEGGMGVGGAMAVEADTGDTRIYSRNSFLVDTSQTYL